MIDRTSYTQAAGYLGKVVDVHIDRPMHSQHPRHRWIYPINYGFIPGTMAPDGCELDAYVIGVDEPLEIFAGVCIAIIKRADDNEDKLVVAPSDNTSFTDGDIRRLTQFQEQFFQSKIIRSHQ